VENCSPGIDDAERPAGVEAPNLLFNSDGRHRTLRRVVAALAMVLGPAAPAAAESRDWAATVYGARISSETGWEDILLNPFGAQYVDAFLIVGALSRSYASYQDGALVLDAEGQVAWNFGDQHHWEFNVAPVVARWQRFPWSRRVDTSVAFGLGLSYATEVPEVEVEIEGESQQLLIYWVAELTAGPVLAPWAISLRLHHRSVAWGLMGDEGGMNAVGLGIRYSFGDVP
jgi:hypothetical protein